MTGFLGVSRKSILKALIRFSIYVCPQVTELTLKDPLRLNLVR